MDKTFIHVLKKSDEYRPIISNTCLWDNCQVKAIRSHSHSEKYLRNISKNSTVYGLALTNSAVMHTKGKFFRKYGVRQASTFSGFCQTHDSQLFFPIETCSFIADNNENEFLLFMRSLFFEYHQKIFVKKRMARFKKLCDEHNIPLNDQLTKIYIEGKDQFIETDFPFYSGEIYSMYNTRNYDDINSIYIRLSKKAPVAVTTVICPLFDDHNGYNIIQPLFSFNIIPDGDSSLIAISWLKKDDAYMQKIIALAKNDTNKLINYLTFMETENYYFSHAFYEKCIKKEKNYIIGALHNRSYSMGYDDVKILYDFIDNDAVINFNC